MGRGIAALGDRLEFVVVTRESAIASSPAKMEAVSQRPVVSIVIAAYNRARLLEKAVRSGLAQSHPGVEIVVSDDASPDDSVAVLRAIGDPRLRINAQPKNVGVWDNWTAALRMARGEFVVFLGDDDFLSERFVERHLEVFASLPALSAVFSTLEGRVVDGTIVGTVRPAFPTGALTPARAMVDELLASRLFFGAGMFRRGTAVEIWEDTRPDGMVADWGLLLRLATRGGASVATCEGCVYSKLEHPVRLSSRPTEVTRLMAEVCERVAPAFTDGKARRDLMVRAAWERVTLARHFAAFGELAQCRRELWHCVRKNPLHWTAWGQWLQSFVMKERMTRTAREQRGLKRAAP